MMKLSGSYFFVIFIFGTLVANIYLPDNSFAETKSKPFSNSCSEYESSEEFVKKASGYCLSEANTRACMKQARGYFKQCNFEGDFKTISREIQRKLLVMLLFTKSRDLAKTL